ncbi:MAG: SUF system NifU family Fe-S cluster assembly protein [Burkholderiales bacterium]
MSATSKLYDRVMMEHIKNARNYREMADATASAEGINPLCGDSFRVFVRVEADTVQDTAFQCECCGISMASASIMTEVVKGRSVADARQAIRTFARLVAEGGDAGRMHADAHAILDVVRELPSRVNCAMLGWAALEAALEGRERATLGS